MAVGKNKKLGKKKGQKKKVIDPFTKKDWFAIKAPSTFSIRHIGYTPATKSAGGRNSADSLRGRCVTVSLGDLKPDGEDEAFRKFRLRIEDVHQENCLTNFNGMDLSTDKLRSLVRKWQTLVEAHTDVKTTDGYMLRIFCIGFTKRRQNANRKTAYAQSSQVRTIRKKMIEIIRREATQTDLKGLVQKLIPEIIGKEIEKNCEGIYPLHNVFIRKVKTLRSPKLDVSKLMELHGGTTTAEADVGMSVERSDSEDDSEADSDSEEG